MQFEKARIIARQGQDKIEFDVIATSEQCFYAQEGCYCHALNKSITNCDTSGECPFPSVLDVLLAGGVSKLTI